jgi:hypothetical protein
MCFTSEVKMEQKNGDFAPTADGINFAEKYASLSKDGESILFQNICSDKVP